MHCYQSPDVPPGVQSFVRRNSKLLPQELAGPPVRKEPSKTNFHPRARQSRHFWSVTMVGYRDLLLLCLAALFWAGAEAKSLEERKIQIMNER